uniref:CADG domain-containing protein n=1 Tax=Steinernema glaseri TaxID=37863 RepID=A0A1I7ZTP6_9BILA
MRCAPLLVIAITAALIPSSQQYNEIKATKGKFFVYQLHSNSFFRKTVDVKWSASMNGKPDLPHWLHLVPSRHRPLAFLMGTPVTALKQLVVHVIARRYDSHEVADQFFTIALNEDHRYNSSTHQIVELHVKNEDAEELINGRGGRLANIEKAIKETFRGRNVNAYIYNILPSANPPPESLRFVGRQKLGAILQVGTQNRFHTNIENLIRGLKSNPQYCNRNALIPLNRQFAQIFEIDWCQFDLKNLTHAPPQIPEIAEQRVAHFGALPLPNAETQVTNGGTPIPPYYAKHYFWDSVLIIPLLLVIIIVLVLGLSLIFFGRREGQHWRDYKTSREQMQEYLTIRDSQKHLRELSVQRQMLSMASERAPTETPSGIHAFLQLKENSAEGAAGKEQSHANTPFSRSRSRSNLPSGEGETRPLIVPNSAVGKQTVAEAVKATGSSLHLYRNPFDDEALTDEEEYGESDNEK